MAVCKCGRTHDGSFGSGKFCSRACANAREHSEESRQKVREKLRKPRARCACGNPLVRSNASGVCRTCSKVTVEKFLAEPVRLYTSSTLRRMLLQLDIVEECSECQIGTSYNRKPIVLEIDHVDGDRQNNRVENLRWLCPNCHSQTSTFKGRNIGTGKVVTDDDFVVALNTCSNIRKALIQPGLRPSGANYERACKLSIEISWQPPTQLQSF